MKKVFKVMFDIKLEGRTLKERKRQLNEAIENFTRGFKNSGIGCGEHSIYFIKILKTDVMKRKKRLPNYNCTGYGVRKSCYSCRKCYGSYCDKKKKYDNRLRRERRKK